MHPLLLVLFEAAAGRFPPEDGAVVVLPPLAPGLEAVVSLTARAYVCTALPADEALRRVPDAYGGATDPDTLLALARGGTVGVLDATLVREGTGGRLALPVRHDLDDHPRVRHARAVRRDVVVRGDERGLVTLGTGLAGRRELSVQALRPGTGEGRSLTATRRDRPGVRGRVAGQRAVAAYLPYPGLYAGRQRGAAPSPPSDGVEGLR